MSITGVSNDFLEDQDFLQQDDMIEIQHFIGDQLIVSHSASFAMKFLLRAFDDFNLSPPTYTVLDTLPLSRKLIKSTPNHKLDTLKQHFNLADPNSHDALNDATATGQFACLLNELSQNK